MKHIRPFQGFSEAYAEKPKFYRFTNSKITDSPEIEITPEERPLWGSEELNDILVGLGFPDKKRGIDFMDEVAFDPEYTGLYGKNVSEIQVDENARLGWSFAIPVNEWYYKGYAYTRALRSSKAMQEMEKNPVYNKFSWSEDPKEKAQAAIRTVHQKGLVGTGTLKDLMSSPFWGKEKAFVWTCDRVLARPIDISKPKQPRPYKNEPVLTKDDFAKREIAAERIGEFWKSEIGQKVKRFKETEDFGQRRQDALSLLDQWAKTI